MPTTNDIYISRFDGIKWAEKLGILAITDGGLIGINTLSPSSSRLTISQSTSDIGSNAAIKLEETTSSKNTYFQWYDSVTPEWYYGETGGYLQLRAGLVRVLGMSASSVVFTVKGASSQSANLQEWQNSSGTALVSISSSGAIIGSALTLTLTDSNSARFLWNNTTDMGVKFNQVHTDGRVSISAFRTGYSDLQIMQASAVTGQWQIGYNALGISTGQLSNYSGSMFATGITIGNGAFGNTSYYAYGETTNGSGQFVVTGLTAGGYYCFEFSGNITSLTNGSETITTAGAAGGFVTQGTSVTVNAPADTVITGRFLGGKASIHFSTSEFPSGITHTGSNREVFIHAHMGGGNQIASHLRADLCFDARRFKFYIAKNSANAAYAGNQAAGYEVVRIDEDNNLILDPDGTASSKFGIGTTSIGARMQINTGAAGTIGQIIKGAASQSANLQEWQDSSSAIVARVSATGFLYSPGIRSNAYNSFDNSISLFVYDGGTTNNFYDGSGVVNLKLIGSTGGVWNENGVASMDWRMESDALTHLFFLDAGVDKIGVNNDTPLTTFDIIGGIGLGVTTKTADYTATSSDFTILCDATGGDIVITLPSAATSTRRLYAVKKTDSSANTVTIDGNGSETIDGATTATLTIQYESITIACDGSDWFII